MIKNQTLDNENNYIENYSNTNLDDKWITEFESNDKLYKDFYKDNVYYINIHLIYINKLNEIEKISKKYFLLSRPNIFLGSELIQTIKMYSIADKRRYSLLSILRYNITLNPDEIPNFVKSNHIWYSNYLTPIKKIDDIKYDKTINTFQDLNELILLFYEKSIDKTLNNMTKKIYLNRQHKKTIKKTT